MLYFKDLLNDRAQENKMSDILHIHNHLPTGDCMTLIINRGCSWSIQESNLWGHPCITIYSDGKYYCTLQSRRINHIISLQLHGIVILFLHVEKDMDFYRASNSPSWGAAVEAAVCRGWDTQVQGSRDHVFLVSSDRPSLYSQLCVPWPESHPCTDRVPPSLWIKFFTFLLDLEDRNWFCTCVLHHFTFSYSHTRSLDIGGGYHIIKTNYNDGGPSNLKMTKVHHIQGPKFTQINIEKNVQTFFFWGGKWHPPSPKCFALINLIKHPYIS
jgi:hypothetical protein